MLPAFGTKRACLPVSWRLSTLRVPSITPETALRPSAVCSECTPPTHQDGPKNAPMTLKIDPEKIARTYDEDTAHWLSALANTHDPQGVLAVGQVMRRIS